MKKELINILKDSLFFTGAGFSSPAGCKLSSGMLDDLKSKSNEYNGEEIFSKLERKAIKFVLSCLYYQSQYRTFESDGQYTYSPNIEEFAQLLRRIKSRENLLPYPVTGNWSDKITTIEQEFKYEDKNSEMSIWESIEQIIKQKCYYEWLKVDNEKLNYLEPLKVLIQKLEDDFKLDIFTLNNDLVLENYFKEENSVYTGFVSNKWIGFEESDVCKNTFTTSRINYYKLHGSIDWIRLSDGMVKQLDKNISDDEVEISPFLIFGHGTKIYTVDPFFTLLEHFKKALQIKKYFFVIGYSFFDPHINNLFFNELASSSDKFLIIINPSLSKNILEDDWEAKESIEKVLKKIAKQKLVSFLQDIQTNSIYTEMPDFNIKQISPEWFEYIQDYSNSFIANMENYLEFVKKLAYEKEQSSKMF